MIFLPGSKNTMGDFEWMRQNGLEAMVKKKSEEIPVFGICGGFQMLGISIDDRFCVEEGGFISGMGLLPIKTILEEEKVRKQTRKTFGSLYGILKSYLTKRQMVMRYIWDTLNLQSMKIVVPRQKIQKAFIRMHKLTTCLLL